MVQFIRLIKIGFFAAQAVWVAVVSAYASIVLNVNGEFSSGSCSSSVTVLLATDACGLGWFTTTGYKYQTADQSGSLNQLLNNTGDSFVILSNQFGNDKISRLFSTTSGKKYSVRFEVRGDMECHNQSGFPVSGNYPAPQANLRVTATGASQLYQQNVNVPLLTAYPPVMSDWAAHSFIITANSSAVTLEFHDAAAFGSACDAAIDNVSVTLIEPAILHIATKSVIVDPATAFNGGGSPANAKMIPGNDVIQKYVIGNTGGEDLDNGSLVFYFFVDTNMSFKTGSVALVNEVGTSGISLSNLQYSTSGSENCSNQTYAHTPSGAFDANVRCIKVITTGSRFDPAAQISLSATAKIK